MGLYLLVPSFGQGYHTDVFTGKKKKFTTGGTEATEKSSN